VIVRLRDVGDLKPLASEMTKVIDTILDIVGLFESVPAHMNEPCEHIERWYSFWFRSGPQK
jgi:hypothetical protein